jgi:hypothetical protein
MVGMPVVEGQVILNQGGEDWNLILGVVVQNLLGQFCLVDIVAVTAQLLVHKALLRGSELAAGNGRVARNECAIKLNVIAGNRVIRIVQDRVKVLSRAAHVARGSIRQVVRIAERPIVDRVFQPLEGLSTEQVVKGAILHLQNHNILDLVLEIGDRSRGMRPGVALRGSSGDCCREGQQTEKSAQIHIESREGLVQGLGRVLGTFSDAGIAALLICHCVGILQSKIPDIPQNYSIHFPTSPPTCCSRAHPLDQIRSRSMGRDSNGD